MTQSILRSRTDLHRRSRRFYRPRLEVLEARNLLAQVLGNILVETFDDPASLPAFSVPKSDGATALPQGVTSFDDIGRITTVDPVTGNTSYQATHPVFHHELSSWAAPAPDVAAELAPGGSTVPTAPQDSAAYLHIYSGFDVITFPDVNSSSEAVTSVSLEVSRAFPGSVIGFTGTGGGVSFSSASPPAGTGDWFTISAGSDTPTASGAPLGPIRNITIATLPAISAFDAHANQEHAYVDNIRVLVQGRTSATLVAGTVNATAIPDQPTLIDVFASDQYPAGDAVTVTKINTSFQGVVQTSLGTAQITTGGITYTAGPNADGTDSFTYTIGDPQGNSAQGVVNVVVDTPPIAPALTITVPHDTTATFAGQITGARDSDGDPVTFAHDKDGNFGSVTIDAQTGAFTYTRSDGGVIQADDFTYKVSDGTDFSIGPVHLVPDNQALTDPVNDDVPLVHGYRGAKTIDVLANDPYPRPDGSTPLGPFRDKLQLVIVQQPQNGQLVINQDYSITYKPYLRHLYGPLPFPPVLDPSGVVQDDTFGYKLYDPIENQASNPATVHLIPADQVPATPPSFNLLFPVTSVGHPITINPFAGTASDPQEPGNDAQAKDANGVLVKAPSSDAEGDPLYLVGVGGASSGQVQIIPVVDPPQPATVEQILYTPTGDTTDDTFTYSVKGDYSGTAPATIHIRFQADPPQLVPAVLPTPLNPALETWNPPSASEEAATIAGDEITGDLQTISYWFSTAQAFDTQITADNGVTVDQAHGVLHDIVDRNGRVVKANLLTVPSIADGKLYLNTDGSFRFISFNQEQSYTFTFAATDGLAANPITVHLYVGGPIDGGQVQYSFHPTDALLSLSYFELDDFFVREKPVYRVGPLVTYHGTVTVDGVSLVVGGVPRPGDTGKAFFYPSNHYYRDSTNPDVLSPGEPLATGEVSFYRQIWDGIVPAFPIRVFINLTAATQVTFHSSTTGNPITASIDPSETGSLVISTDPQDLPNGLPAGTTAQDFPQGFFHLEIGAVYPGAHIAVTITAPAGETIAGYWKYVNVSVPGGSNMTTWHSFSYDPTTDTGAETNADNPSIPPNEIILHFVDNGRGDDNPNDGIISDPAGLLVRSAQFPQERYVTQLYRKLLNRDPETTGLEGWVSWMVAGASPLDVARGIYDSPEHRSLQVDGYYARFLHRSADPGGRAGWVNALLAGWSETSVEIDFLTSQEYLAEHPNVYAFVGGLYQDVAGLAPDWLGTAYWVKRIGTHLPLKRRALAAWAFLTWNVTEGNEVDDFYRTFLDRSADAPGRAGWLGALQGGWLTPEQTAELFLSSPEFWQRAEAAPL
jgi:hypothetical protein